MTTSPGPNADSLNNDALVAEIKRLRGVVQAEFDSLTADGDRSNYEARIAELDAATSTADDRGLDVAPGK